MSKLDFVLSKKFKNIFFITSNALLLSLLFLLITFFACGVFTVNNEYLNVQTCLLWIFDVSKITEINTEYSSTTLTKCALSVAYITIFVITVTYFIKATIKMFSLTNKNHLKEIQYITSVIFCCVEKSFFISCCFVFISSCITYNSSPSMWITILYVIALPLLILFKNTQLFLSSNNTKNLPQFVCKLVESMTIFVILCVGYRIIASPALFNLLNAFEPFFDLLNADIEFFALLKVFSAYFIKPTLIILLTIYYCLLLKNTISIFDDDRENKSMFLKTLIFCCVAFGFVCISNTLYSYQQASQDLQTSSFIVQWFLLGSKFFIPLGLLSASGLIVSNLTVDSKNK